MRAMVLAAGLGTRLRPLTGELPKCLVPVAGRAMIEYSLLLLKHYGIREIIVNIHYLGKKVEQHLGDGSRLGLDIRYSREQTLLDTGGGLLGAREFLDGGSFLVINSDVLIDLPLNDLIASHQSRGAAATLVLRADAKADAYGAIETDRNGRICRFLNYRLPGSKHTKDRRSAVGGRPSALRKYMFTGVQILEPRIFEYMQEPGPFSLTKLTYPRMLLGGEALYGFSFRGYWQDLGTVARIGEAEDALNSKKCRLHYLHRSDGAISGHG